MQAPVSVAALIRQLTLNLQRVAEDSLEMDSQNLHLYIDFVGSSGVILSPEQKAALQTSLVVLKNNHKFEQVKLWGKILGIKEDYYIAQGFSNDQFADKTTLYRSGFATL